MQPNDNINQNLNDKSEQVIPEIYTLEQDFGLLSKSFRITAGEDLVYRVHIKSLFSLKKQINVFSDEAENNLVLTIQQRNISSIDETFKVIDATGQDIGAFKVGVMKSFMGQRWQIYDATGSNFGEISQENTLNAFNEGHPNTYFATVNDQPVCRYDELASSGVAQYKMSIDFTNDPRKSFNRALGISAAILLAVRNRGSKTQNSIGR